MSGLAISRGEALVRRATPGRRVELFDRPRDRDVTLLTCWALGNELGFGHRREAGAVCLRNARYGIAGHVVGGPDAGRHTLSPPSEGVIWNPLARS